MSSISLIKAHLITAGSLSLLAQAISLTPVGRGLFLQFIPPLGNVVIILTVFAFSLYFYLLAFRILSLKSLIGWQPNGLLLIIQILSVTGILFILGSSSSRGEWAGFFLTSVITLLTTYLMSTGNASGIDVHEPAAETEGTFSDLISDSDATINALNEQINSLAQQLASEKHRTTQLILLNELSQQLEAELDQPVSAQLAVNTLERAINCTMVTLMIYEAEKQEFVVLAAAGKMTNSIPSGYRQDADSGLLGRTKRIKKTQIINDASLTPDFLSLDNHTTPRSIISVPILHQGHVKGVLEISSDKTYAFNSTD